MVAATSSSSVMESVFRELCKQPREQTWLEFKHNNDIPHDIGEYLSALSNAAALEDRPYGYMLWGVEDETRNIVGTTFVPSTAKKGNEPLETWLLRLLSPRIHFKFFELTIDGQSVVLLQIDRAFRHPVRFQGEAFIRIGQVKKPIKEAPDVEAALWRVFDATAFEDLIALENVSEDDVLSAIDYPAYFDLLEMPLPANKAAILKALSEDNVICLNASGAWDITNLGGILFAKRLDQLRPLQRKAIRVIQYRGIDRRETIKEQVGSRGYASGFQGLISYINGLLPSNEVIGQALRRTVPMFPELAVRELVANALIHQDLFATGTGPMVEIFHDRIEITNPGAPLVDPQRFIDTPPKSRNEALASLMRRVRICEERGSGIDKVVLDVELYQLPAPLFEAPDGFTRIVLFAHRSLAEMDRADRVRACYLHACLRYVSRQAMTNTSLRERFGISEKNSATASRLLNEAVEAGDIVIQNPEEGTRNRRYVPWWAASLSGRKDA